MIEALKKTMLVGVGAGLVAAEKVEATLNEFVKSGRISAEEARAATRRVVEESEEEFARAKKGLNDLFAEMLERANVAQHADLRALEARVAALESKVADDREVSA